jgi:hypothetical protein
MTVLFIILAILLLYCGGYLWSASKGLSIFVAFLGVMSMGIGIGAFEIDIKSLQKDYYHQRIPDLKQLLDNYEVEELEQKILKIKEGAQIETND